LCSIICTVLRAAIQIKKAIIITVLLNAGYFTLTFQGFNPTDSRNVCFILKHYIEAFELAM